MWEAGAELTALGSYCSEGPQRASAEIWMLVPKPSPAWLLLLSLTNPLSGSLTLTPSTAHAVSLLYGNCASYVKFCECHRIEIFFTLYWILLRNSKITVQLQMFSKILTNISILDIRCPHQGRLCIIRYIGETPITAQVQAAPHRLSATAQPDSPPRRGPTLKSLAWNYCWNTAGNPSTTTTTIVQSHCKA